MKKVTDIRCYEDLAIAVVNQAVKDYRGALTAHHKTKDSEKKARAADKISELEKFFCSDNFNKWTTLSGPTIMRKVKEELIEYDYNLKKLNFSHAMYRSKNSV